MVERRSGISERPTGGSTIDDMVMRGYREDPTRLRPQR
jgi:hypothetical protein